MYHRNNVTNIKVIWKLSYLKARQHHFEIVTNFSSCAGEFLEQFEQELGHGRNAVLQGGEGHFDYPAQTTKRQS